MRNDAAEAAALAYLHAQLGSRAPQVVQACATFDEAPLEGEGAVTVLAFDLKPEGPGANPRHYVVIGQTQPNYYPAYGLTPDEIYSLHIGTQFFLGVGVHVVEFAHEPPDARDGVAHFVETCNPGVPRGPIVLAGLFRGDGSFFAVYRLTVGDQEVYCFGADLPPAFSPLIDQPPQVALRLYLGRLLRAEAQHARR